MRDTRASAHGHDLHAVGWLTSFADWANRIRAATSRGANEPNHQDSLWPELIEAGAMTLEEAKGSSMPTSSCRRGRQEKVEVVPPSLLRRATYPGLLGWLHGPVSDAPQPPDAPSATCALAPRSCHATSNSASRPHTRSPRRLDAGRDPSHSQNGSCRIRSYRPDRAGEPGYSRR